MIAPIMMIKGVIEGMEARKWGRIVNITSAMVKTPKPRMGLSTGARAGLTALSKSLSVRVAKNNVTINNLLPERIDSPRQIYMAQKQAEHENILYEEARQRIADGMAEQIGQRVPIEKSSLDSRLFLEVARLHTGPHVL